MRWPLRRAKQITKTAELRLRVLLKKMRALSASLSGSDNGAARRFGRPTSCGVPRHRVKGEALAVKDFEKQKH